MQKIKNKHYLHDKISQKHMHLAQICRYFATCFAVPVVLFLVGGVGAPAGRRSECNGLCSDEPAALYRESARQCDISYFTCSSIEVAATPMREFLRGISAYSISKQKQVNK